MLKVEKPWYAPGSPDEIRPIPWLHPSAISFMEEILCPEYRVLEHGCGGSTLWFASRVASVVTIEHDLAWRNKIRILAPANVSILEYLPELKKPAFDLFLIDGERMKRGECILASKMLVLPGGWVVLDNANRPEYTDERETLSEHAKLIDRFDNNIHCSKYFVTEFWRCE